MYGNWASGGIEQPERMRWWQPEGVNLGLSRLTMQAFSLLSLRASNCPFLTAFDSVCCTVLRCARDGSVHGCYGEPRRAYTVAEGSRGSWRCWRWALVWFHRSTTQGTVDNWSGCCQLADGVVSARIDPVIRDVLTKPGYPTQR